ncbi:(2Fe-2S)-binding protein [Pectinatus brassicae]|uniref:Carbon-monoxide dehydrogenase small subunit n=1 Tax=Pectinatus brassicae TaxID=862415 RepID=A0A840UEQ9_9FIRM|nr:(2Fe-2S)-binding protein [Pectinatus brassicae]MBB5335596.1 carbon-monoxide dehydrogenase small subunit [Pectinatus brassicae]
MADISFILNGKNVTIDADATKRLLDVLREDMGFTGPKEGCGEGECGACSVLMDHELVSSCLVPVGNAAGHEIITIEGFSEEKRYEKLANAFAEAGAVQCGFCTPGMILAAEALLNKIPHPTEMQIRQAISGNLCRCTGYNMIIEAIQMAADTGDGLW